MLHERLSLTEAAQGFLRANVSAQPEYMRVLIRAGEPAISALVSSLAEWYCDTGDYIEAIYQAAGSSQHGHTIATHLADPLFLTSEAEKVFRLINVIDAPNLEGLLAELRRENRSSVIAATILLALHREIDSQFSETLKRHLAGPHCANDPLIRALIAAILVEHGDEWAVGIVDSLVEQADMERSTFISAIRLEAVASLRGMAPKRRVAATIRGNEEPSRSVYGMEWPPRILIRPELIERVLELAYGVQTYPVNIATAFTLSRSGTLDIWVALTTLLAKIELDKRTVTSPRDMAFLDIASSFREGVTSVLTLLSFVMEYVTNKHAGTLDRLLARESDLIAYSRFVGDSIRDRYELRAEKLTSTDPDGVSAAQMITDDALNIDDGDYRSYGYMYGAQMYLEHIDVLRRLLPSDYLDVAFSDIFNLLRKWPLRDMAKSIRDIGEQVSADGIAVDDLSPDEFAVLIRSIPRDTEDQSAREPISKLLQSLVNDARMLNWSAVWTTLAIRLAVHERDGFQEHGNEARLILAYRVLRQVLEQRYEPWRNNLGARRIALVRLIDLIATHGAIIGLDAQTAGRMVFEGYLDFQFTSERLYMRALTRQEVLNVRRLVTPMTAMAIDAAVYLGLNLFHERRKWAWRAMIAADLGRSRILREVLATASRKTPSGVPEDLMAHEQQLLIDLRAILLNTFMSMESPTSSGNKSQPIADLRAKTRMALEVVWTRMERDCPQAGQYVRSRRDEAIFSEDAMEAQIHRVMDRHKGSIALVMMHYALDVLRVIVIGPHDDHPICVRVELPSKDVRRFLDEFEVDINKGISSGSELRPTKWMKFGERILAHVPYLLRDADAVCFLGHQFLNWIPLHALTVGGAPLIANWNVFYAPSISALESALDTTCEKVAPIVFGCAGAGDDSATGAIMNEAVLVSNILGSNPWLSDRATIDAFRTQAPGARVLHVSCHGQFDSVHPLESSLEFYDGHVTASDLLGLNLTADLVTLSACSTGSTGLNPGDDTAGLVPAVLAGGSRSVISTLWNTDPESTRDWMKLFYEDFGAASGDNQLRKSAALRTATLDLLGSFGMGQPYRWAPFILTGSPM